MSEALAERTFLSVYGSPMLQAAVGIDPGRHAAAAEGGKDARCIASCCRSRIDELKSRIATGGLRECLVRGLLYVGMARGSADERGFAAIRRLRAVKDDRPPLDIGRVQGAGARAIFHAAHRSGGGARSHSRYASVRRRGQGARGSPRSTGC